MVKLKHCMNLRVFLYIRKYILCVFMYMYLYVYFCICISMCIYVYVCWCMWLEVQLVPLTVGEQCSCHSVNGNVQLGHRTSWNTDCFFFCSFGSFTLLPSVYLSYFLFLFPLFLPAPSLSPRPPPGSACSSRPCMICVWAWGRWARSLCGYSSPMRSSWLWRCYCFSAQVRYELYISTDVLFMSNSII